MKKPKLKECLEQKLGVKGLEKKVEPFPGANQEVGETLKENFEIAGINPAITIDDIDEIVINFYEDDGYTFRGFIEEPLKGQISNNKYAFYKEKNDLILVQITHCDALVCGSVHYLTT